MADETRAQEVAEKRKFWKEQIENWQKSNLTQAEFCRKNNLILHQFGYWKRKTIKPPASSVSLIQVAMKPGLDYNCANSSPLRLVFSNEFHVEIDRGFDPVTLRQLLYTLTQD